MNENKIIVILGPTASNKSLLAEKLHSLIDNSIIVNYDAFQIYKEMNIGTAKPSKEDLAKGYYYLYDYLDMNEENNICLYQKISRELINNHKDNTIIFVGGSGLYIKSCLFDYHFDNEEIKMPLNYLNDKSNEELHSLLENLDKEEASKIHLNNRKRMLRSIYMISLNNKNKKEINQNNKDKLLYPSSLFIFINPSRNDLYLKINERVDKMIKNGLKEEALNLIKKYGKENKALLAIGYKEFFDLKNDESNLNEVIEKIKQNTRNYSKRQITFFKHQFPIFNEFTSIEEAYEFIKKDLL